MSSQPSSGASQPAIRAPLLLGGIAAVVLVAALAASGQLWIWFIGLARAGEANLGALGVDYRAFAVAGKLVADGVAGSLYGSPSYSLVNASEFVYPPWFALFMLPWSSLSLTVGYWWWLLTTLSIAVASHFLLSRRAGVAIAIAAVAGISGFYATLLGQSVFLVVAIVAFAAFGLRHDRFVLVGLAIAALSFKPHIAVGIAVVCILVPGGRKALLVAGAAIAVLFGVSEVAIPGSTIAWLDWVWRISGSLVSPGAEITIPAAIEHLVGVEISALGRGLFLAAGFGWVWNLQRRRLVDRGSLLLCALGVAVLVGPHALSYDVLVLSPAVALAWSTRPDGRRLLAVGGAAVIAFMTISPFVWVWTAAIIDFRLPISACALAAFIGYAGETLPSRSGRVLPASV